MIFNNFPKIVAFHNNFILKMKKITLLLIFGLIAFKLSFSQLVSYDFNTSPYLNASFISDHCLASSIALSSGTISTNKTTSAFPDLPYIEGSGGWTATTLSSAKNFYITLTAQTGYLITLNSISIEALVSSAGPSDLSILINDSIVFTDTAPIAIAQINQPVTGFTGLATVTVKICGWNNGSRVTSGSGLLKIDNLIVDGILEAIPAKDSTSSVSLGNFPIPATISSLNTISNPIKLMELVFTDSASGDGVPTIIDSIRLVANAFNQLSDWTKVYDQVVLKGTQFPDGILGTVEKDAIRFNTSGFLYVDEGLENKVNCELWVSIKKELPSADNRLLGFYVDSTLIFCAFQGSQIHFGKASTGLNQLKIEVIGSQAQVRVSDDLLYTDSIFFVEVEITDVNGNRDLDDVSSIILSAQTDEGILTSDLGLNGNLEKGAFTFNKLYFSGADTVVFSILSESLGTFSSKPIFVGHPFFSDNFEQNNLNQWFHNSDWKVSDEYPLEGNYSLKHNINGVEGYSYVNSGFNSPGLDNGRMVWRMVLQNGNFDPTSSNRFWYYVMASDSNLLTPNIHGYAVGVNLSGSTDSLSLWKVMEDGTRHLLIKSGLDWDATDTVAIEVVRDVSGFWQLGWQTGNQFTQMAYSPNVEDVLTDSLLYHGLVFQYSSTRAGLLWADGFNFFQLNSPPVFLKAQGINSKTVVLTFSENITDAAAGNTSNFNISSLSDSGISIDSTVLNPANHQQVFLYVNQLKTADYQAHVIGLTDEEGSAMGLQSKGFSFRIPAISGDVVFNEILFDPTPAVDLPEYDFLELYNQGENPFYLGGWQLDINGVIKTFPDSIIEKGEYLIVTSSAAVLQFQVFGKSLSGISTTDLTNAGKSLKLTSHDGTLIDSLFYSPFWITDENKTDGGWSLERIDPKNYCGSSGNWTVSMAPEGGTPGKANSVAAFNPDLLSPFISSFQIGSANTLTLILSEPIVEKSYTELLNFYLDSIGNPDSVQFDGVSGNVLELYFHQNFESPKTYQLTVKNLSDPCGNVSSDTVLEFLYYLPQPNDIIINEIMADPNPPVELPLVSYLELYNRSTFTIDLQDWKLFYGEYFRTLKPFQLKSGDYLLLCPSGIGEELMPFGDVMDILSSTALTTTGKLLQLQDSSGQLISEVDYRKSWYGTPDKEDGGWSLERIDPDNLCSGSFNWIASSDNRGGTPGMPNAVYAPNLDAVKPKVTFWNIVDTQRIYVEFSEPIINSQLSDSIHYVLHGTYLPVTGVTPDIPAVELFSAKPFIPGKSYTFKITGLNDLCGNPMKDTLLSFVFNSISPNDLVFTEVMIDETPSEGLPEREYIELYNRSGKTIELENWKLMMGGKSKPLPRYQIRPKNYLVLCAENAALELQSFGNTLGIPGFSSLPNEYGALQLLDTMDQKICELYYSNTWFQDSEKDNGGWSLEIIDRERTCGPLYNWKASESGNGGTPGKVNSVDAPNLDALAPSIKDVIPISGQQVWLEFSETPEFDSKLDRNNYQVNSLGIPQSVQTDSINDARVLLIFTGIMESGQLQQLQVKNVVDYCGNSITDTTIEFEQFTPELYQVVINEIMATPTPSVGLPEAEYLELYNSSEHSIHLYQWTLKIGSSVRELPYGLFPPKSYLILTSKVNGSLFTDYGNVLEVENLPSLSGTGNATLYQGGERFMCSTGWSSSWFFDDFKGNGGFSLERIDPNNADETQSNWNETFSEKGGTPGRQNSVYRVNPDVTAPNLMRAYPMNDRVVRIEFSEPMDYESINYTDFQIINQPEIMKQMVSYPPNLWYLDLFLNSPLQNGVTYYLKADESVNDLAGNQLRTSEAKFALASKAPTNGVVINELLYNPGPTAADFVELYNRSAFPANLNQFLLASRDDDGNLKGLYPVSPFGTIVFPSEYVVLTTNGQAIQNTYFLSNEQAFYDMQTLPSFADDAGTVVLLDTSGIVIDEFHYTDDMQFPLLQTTEGVSLERVHFDRPTNEKSNWHSASEPSGWATPGYQNSMFAELNPSESEVQLEPEAFSPDNDGYNDLLNIHYQFNEPGYVATISIFDDKGRKVRTLTQNELLSTQGILTWDGLTDDKTKTPMGIYLVYFEIYNLQGDLLKYKKVCVVSAKI